MRRSMLACGLLLALDAGAQADPVRDSIPSDAFNLAMLNSIEADAYTTLLAQNCGRIDLDASADITLTFIARASGLSRADKFLVNQAFERGQSAAQAQLDMDMPAACAGMAGSDVARALSLARHERRILDERAGEQVLSPIPGPRSHRRAQRTAPHGTRLNPFATPSETPGINDGRT